MILKELHSKNIFFTYIHSKFQSTDPNVHFWNPAHLQLQSSLHNVCMYMHYANICNLAILSEIKGKKKFTRNSLLIIDDEFALYQKILEERLMVDLHLTQKQEL